MNATAASASNRPCNRIRPGRLRAGARAGGTDAAAVGGMWFMGCGASLFSWHRRHVAGSQTHRTSLPHPRGRTALNALRPSSPAANPGPAERAAPKESPVCDDVDGNEHGRKRPLDLPGEARRVEDPSEVMGEKAAAVAGFATQLSPMILERRQRTDAVRDLHPGAPRERRQMQPGDPAPAPGEKATEDDEGREREMDD